MARSIDPWGKKKKKKKREQEWFVPGALRAAGSMVPEPSMLPWPKPPLMGPGWDMAPATSTLCRRESSFGDGMATPFQAHAGWKGDGREDGRRGR